MEPRYSINDDTCMYSNYIKFTETLCFKLYISYRWLFCNLKNVESLLNLNLTDINTQSNFGMW